MPQHECVSIQRTGNYRPPREYWPEQFRFLFSIQKTVPKVLENLSDSVLPRYNKCKRKGIEEPGYDPRTWLAIWDWANKNNLIPLQPDNLTLLNSLTEMPRIIKMAKTIDKPSQDSNYLEVKEEDSVFIIFGLGTLARVVLCTLKVWSESFDKIELKWKFPESAPIHFLMKGDKPVPLTGRQQVDVPHDYYPNTFKFDGGVWDIREDSRKKVTKSITDDFKVKLKEWLDHNESTANKMGLKKKNRKNTCEHFYWLALFQVEKMSYSDIADHVKKTSEDYKDTPIEDLNKTVRDAIRRTAQFVLGPSWRSWLREVKPGRPKK